jgi:Zn-dependent protease
LNLYIALPILLFSVVVHECAHGLAAYRAGDPTAYNLGRITLNPLPHIDLFGSIVVPVILIVTRTPFFIAWAKPVPVNPALFRNPRSDDIRVSVAGPLSNVFLAILFTLIGIILSFVMPDFSRLSTFQVGLLDFCRLAVLINLFLAFFNLIPIFPLDGSHILANLLPPDLEYRYRSLSRYGFILLLILIMTPIIDIFLLPAWFFREILDSILIAFYR